MRWKRVEEVEEGVFLPLHMLYRVVPPELSSVRSGERT